MNDPVIEVRDLEFRYPSATVPALAGFTMSIEEGARLVLVGHNGAGKSTLLHVLAGKHMVPRERVRVLGRPAFHDTTLAADVSFLGGTFRFDVDIAVEDILARTPGGDPARRARLIEVLGVDPTWHMHAISDGQRRRVQLLLGLLRPVRVLLLDEITTDLDLIARADLLAFLREETEVRGATILYATHILDVLEEWATHIAWLEHGRLVHLGRLEDLPELGPRPAGHAAPRLYRVVERWLRERGRRPPG